MADPPRYPDSNNDSGDYPGAPRWVKVFGIILAILVLLFVVAKLTGISGRHGPGRHLPFGDADGPTPSSSITEEHTPPGRLGSYTAREGSHG